MTAVVDRPVAAGDPPAPANPAEPSARPARLRLAAAAYLSAAAAGWMLGGVFQGSSARLLAVSAPALGVGLVVASHRARRPAVVQHLAFPLAVVAAGLAVAATGGRASVGHLVILALRGGGLSQPPVAFDAGWRFLLVAVTVLFGSAAAGTATARRSPGLAVIGGAAVVVVGALVQPASAENASVLGSLVLLVAALGVSFSATDDEPSGGGAAFEIRRLVRGGAVMVGLLVALLAVSRLGFLFPASSAHQVIPPKRPQTPVAEADRVLFSVRSDRSVTWRLGVLDGYDGRSLLTPPFDTGRFVDVRSKQFRGSGVRGPTFRATFTIADQQGHVVPAPASPERVVSRGATITFDPRTQQLRLPTRQADAGVSYSVDAPIPPTAAQLAASPPPPASMREFLTVPAPPPAVVDLLTQAPATPAFSRLQFVRNVYYSHVVAAGPGNPVDVPPARVAAMLGGQPASPYEISAGEVLLARWAGVPARLGYGYYGGDVQPDGSVAFRPRHGATWLEAYFEGSGWVPIVGSPPRAQTSLRRSTRRDDTTARPSDELALIVYVPVRLRTVQLLYTVARYWFARGVLVAGMVGGLIMLVPGAAKVLRRRRRRRWAGTGRPERIRVAYAEVRDTAADLDIGAVHATPFELLDAVEPDEEHRQLAWLVTRALWGDLARDLAEPDVVLAQEMATSVSRRLRRAQPLLARLGAIASTASLRTSWDPLLPTAWPRRAAGRARVVRAVAAGGAIAASVVAVLVTVHAVAGPTAARPGALPTRLAPASIGDVTVRPEPALDGSYRRAGTSSAVAAGRVFSLRQSDQIQGSLQIGALTSDLDVGDDAVRRQVLKSIGGGRFTLTRVGQSRLYSLALPEQRFLLWFPPAGRYYELMVTRSGFSQAGGIFTSVLEYQRTGQVGAATGPGVPVPDPRRGLAG